MTIEMLQNKLNMLREGVKKADSGIAFMYKMDRALGREPDPQISVIKQIDDRIIELLNKAEIALGIGDLNGALDFVDKTLSLMKCAALISGTRC